MRASAPYLDDIARTAAELWSRGWAEANAGNLSIRLSPTRLLVKRAGTRMRDLARDTQSGLCVLTHRSYSSDGSHPLPAGSRPTSELPTHLAVQQVLEQSRPGDRAVLHTHPTSLVALCHLVPDPKRLLRVLLRMHVEAPILLEDRLTAIQVQTPGSEALARSTARALEQFSAVIWPFHGIVATGPDLASALDIMELTDKMARMALDVLSRLRRPRGI
jgi:rhamnulose-1-phosphate aldolase